MSTAAIGVDASAHTYSGTPTSSMSTMLPHTPPGTWARISGGKKACRPAATTRPSTTQPKMSSNRSTKAKRRPCRKPGARDAAAISAAPPGPVSSQQSAGSGAAGSTSAAGPSPAASRFSTRPAVRAVTAAATGRTTAMTGPSRAYVSRMDVTLVSGVEIRKESVAPRLAPRLRSVTAVGSTLQEHSGKGTPMSVASTTERVRAPRNKPTIASARTSPSNRPASRKPTSRKRDDSTSRLQKEASTSGQPARWPRPRRA